MSGTRRVGPDDKGLDSRLPHRDGANVDNPFLEVRFTLTYWQGEWAIRRHDQYGNDNGEIVPLNRETVALLHGALAGTRASFISPDVLDHNRVKWLEALEDHTREHHRRAVQAAEVALVEARRSRRRAQDTARRVAGAMS